jgi:phosphoribosylformylglycinamidine synthase
LEGLVKSALDVSDGGLACCLAESAIGGGVGAIIELDTDQRPDIALFGEVPGLIVVTMPEQNLEHFGQLALDLPVMVIGRVGGDRLIIRMGGSDQVNIPLAQAAQAWESSLETMISR